MLSFNNKSLSVAQVYQVKMKTREQRGIESEETLFQK